MPDISPERCGCLLAPPSRGSRIGAADPRAPSLSLPLKEGGENEPLPSRSIREAFSEAASVLRRAGIETPELDARLLLCHAAGLTHETYIARAREALQLDCAARLDDAIARRIAREPVSRITGTREFYGRAFFIDAHTLDARPDTETLIEAALEIAAPRAARKLRLRLLDLGTGTGCLLVTLLAELLAAIGVGTDVSQGALALARQNAERLGVAGRAAFLAADWLDGIVGTFDLILANPPYIPSAGIAGLKADVSAYDPHLALDGGPDGLQAYRRIAARAGAVLAEEGRLLVEIGEGQAEAVAQIFRAAGLTPDKAQPVMRDLAGRPRVVVAGR